MQCHRRRRGAREGMRPAAAAFLIACGVLLAALLPSAEGAPAQTIRDFELGNYTIGGDFALVDQSGNQATLKDYAGKAVLISFGYTHCPDVCPTTLLEFGKVLKALGKEAQSVRALFITVDPERDTALRMTKYLKFFHPDIIGLTGSKQTIADVTTRYNAPYKRIVKVAGKEYYMAHSTFVYLLDRNGRVRFLVPHELGAPMMLDGLRLILDGKA